MDGYLKQNLDEIKKIIRKDWDMIFCLDGMEGSGKSVIAQQIASYCDPKFSLDNIAFTPAELEKAILKSKKYQAVIFDEALTGLSSRASMTMINRNLISMLAEIRQRNLFVFVVMPTFFDLDRNVALWRTRGLIHVYTGPKFQRGFFAYYNKERKTGLYVHGKKYYSYSKPGPSFRGRFTNHYTVDETEYRRKKLASLKDRDKERKRLQERKAMEAELFARVMGLPETITHDTRIKILGIPRSTYFYRLSEFRNKLDTEPQGNQV